MKKLAWFVFAAALGCGASVDDSSAATSGHGGGGSGGGLGGGSHSSSSSDGGQAGGGAYPPGAIGCDAFRGPAPIDAAHPCVGKHCEVCGEGALCGYIDRDFGPQWGCCGNADHPGDPLNCCAAPAFPDCYNLSSYFGAVPGTCSYASGSRPGESPWGTYPPSTCASSQVCGFTGSLWECCDPATQDCCKDPCDPECPYRDLAQCDRCSAVVGPLSSWDDPSCDDDQCFLCLDKYTCGWNGQRWDCCKPGHGECCTTPGTPGCP